MTTCSIHTGLMVTMPVNFSIFNLFLFLNICFKVEYVNWSSCWGRGVGQWVLVGGGGGGGRCSVR